MRSAPRRAALADLVRRVDDPGRCGTAGLEKLARDIPQPHEPWAQAFFEELERVFPEGDGEAGASA